jgi:hypothetical protein
MARGLRYVCLKAVNSQRSMTPAAGAPGGGVRV